MGALFYERIKTRPDSERVILPVFSLNDDRPGLINCRTTFVEEGDPTGYKWAKRYLVDWVHFLRLAGKLWFQEALEGWREELKIKQTSDALQTISMISSQDNHKGQLAAARYLANREWEKNKRGRPSKQELDGELKSLLSNIEVEEEDLKRITRN